MCTFTTLEKDAAVYVCTVQSRGMRRCFMRYNPFAFWSLSPLAGIPNNYLSAGLLLTAFFTHIQLSTIMWQTTI